MAFPAAGATMPNVNAQTIQQNLYRLAFNVSRKQKSGMIGPDNLFVNRLKNRLAQP